MSSALDSFHATLLGDKHRYAVSQSKLLTQVASANEVIHEIGESVAKLNPYRDVTEKQASIGRVGYTSLGFLVISVHLLAFWVYVHSNHHSSIIKPKQNEVEVEFFKPETPPPPKVEQPPPPPPKEPPKVQPQQPPRPAPALRTPVADQEIKSDDMTVKENTEAPKSTGPVVADAPPAPVVAPPPPPPPKEEPVTEATGYAGYMKNPAPEYPAQALRMGFEGKVVLKVRVLANGTPSTVEVKQSSGKRILDDAAIAAVKTWTFSPSKKGSTPIDGWATVPLEFKIAQ